MAHAAGPLPAEDLALGAGQLAHAVGKPRVKLALVAVATLRLQ